MKYLRKKGRWKNGEGKFVIEENHKYLRTLPPIDELLILLRKDTPQQIVSQKEGVSVQTSSQRFSQSLLTEQKKQDTSEPTEEEILASLEEIDEEES